MSTKTSIKRIALVAAAALTLGGFSAVSANAANTVTGTSVFALTLGGGTTSAATQVVGGFASFTITETITTASSAGVVANMTSSGVGSIVSGDAAPTTGAVVGLSNVGSSTTAVFPTNAVSLYSGSGVSAATAYATAFTVSSSVAGVQTITYTPVDATGAPGTAITQTITWGSAPVVSAQYSALNMVAGTAGNAKSGYGFATTYTAVTTAVSAPKSNASGANTTAVAVLGVVTNSSASNTLLTEKVTATISGPGTLAGGTSATVAGATLGRSITVTESAGAAWFFVYPDGTPGATTVTITDGTTTLGTRTVSFYGTPAKATVTQNLFIAKAGAASLGLANQAADGSATTVAQTFAYTVEVVDSNGTDVAGATVKATSSNTAIIASSSCTESTGTLGAGFWNCTVVGTTGAASGSTATVTFQVSSAANTTYDISATPITFAIGGSIATQALSLDAGSYTPLAPLRLITTAKDSKGNLAYDQDVTLLTSLVSSVAMGGAGLSSPSKIVNGVGKTSIGANYAPATAGDFVISAVDNASGTSAALSVTGVSTGTSSDAQGSLALDAANAATDAANNAYDEAQNATQAASDALAAVTALSAQVEALIATVKSLAAMVAKIKAKVKA